MRKVFLLMPLSFVLFSCSDKTNHKIQDSLYRDSVEAVTINSSSTLNYIDRHGKRQGHWEITGIMQNDSAYDSDKIVEEGRYVKGQKEGEWMEYYPDGKLKGKGEYRIGKKAGRWKQYDENGKETGDILYVRSDLL